MDDPARVLHEFLHLIDDPPVRVQLIVLEQGLILFGFEDGPDVVAESCHSLVQLDLRVLVRSQVRELLRELIERFYEILDQDSETGILTAKVGVYEVGLHLSEPFKHLRPLSPDRLEHPQTVSVVVSFELSPERPLALLVQSHYAFA